MFNYPLKINRISPSVSDNLKFIKSDYIPSLKKIKGMLFVILLALLFASCSEDVVIVKQEDFDPPRFNWRSMDIYNIGFADIWAQDTSKIFLLNHYNKSLYIVSGGNTEIHFAGEYGLEKLQGLSNNEVYIFGSTWFPDNNLTIIKWNGAGFEYHPTGIILNTSIGIRGLAVSSNEIWIISRSGICKFDGVNTTNYVYENPQLTPVDFFLSKENKVQYIAEKWSENSIQTCLYEFQDTGFVKIFDYIRNPNINMTYTFLREIGGYKYGLELKRPPTAPWSICTHYFSDLTFTPYFCFNNGIEANWPTESNNPVGYNLQNFIFLVNTSRSIFDTTRIGIIHWNSNKISKELELNPRPESYPYDKSILFNINNGTYLILEPTSKIEVICTLYFGTMK